MFHHHEKTTKPARIKPCHDLIAITPPAILLSEGRRPALLNNIIESTALDAARFNSLCLTLLHHFGNHCQRLPETAHSYYALPGGLLDHALNRTEAALQLFRQYLVLGHESEPSEEQKRWIYALYSASILQGIGKLQLDYRVNLYDKIGHLLKQWNPLLDHLTTHASYYDYEFIAGSEDDLRHRLNLVLACQLMPEAGFAWIAEDPDVLAAWLALLNEDMSAAGILAAILERADAIAIQRDLNELLAKHVATGGSRPAKLTTFIDTAPESIIEKDRILGAEFLKWLTQALEKGQFPFNKAPLLMMPAGLIMGPEIFKLFMRDHPEVRLWQAVQKGLLSLGLHRREQMGENKIVLEKYAIALPDQVQLHHPTTGKTTTVSAIELIHRQQAPGHPEAMNHLSLSGKWQTMEANTSKLQSGLFHRE